MNTNNFDPASQSAYQQKYDEITARFDLIDRYLDEAHEFATICRDWEQQHSSVNVDRMNQQIEAREILEGLNDSI